MKYQQVSKSLIYFRYCSPAISTSTSRSIILYYFYDQEAIVQAIKQRGFEIRCEKIHSFRPDEVESLYIRHLNDDFFKTLVDVYTA